MSDKTITIPGITGQNESFVWEEVSDKSGNCFYESIAHLIKGDSRRCGSIRADISQYIYNHWDVFKDFISDEDFKKAGISLKKPVDVLKNSPDQAEQEYLREKYKDLINTRGVWGDSTSIKAASEVFKVNIVIVKENGEKNQQYPDPNNSNLTYRKTIYLRYQGGNHYQPLINLKEKTAKIWAANIPDDAILTSLAREQIVGILLITDKKKLEAELFEYLRTKSDEELKKFYISILKFSKPKEETVLPKKKQPELSETFSGIFESFASLFSNPVFIESLTKLFAGFRTIFHKIMVAFNPGAEFDESEKSWPYNSEKFSSDEEEKQEKNFYSDLVEIFSTAGEEGRKLYRTLLKRISNGVGLTREQFLNGLLCKLKEEAKKQGGLFSKNGHKIMIDIEKLVFKGEKNPEDMFIEIEKNLKKALQYKGVVNLDIEGFNSITYAEIISIIKHNFIKIATQIKELKEKLLEDFGLSDEQKVKFWESIQSARLKLSHFMLKIKAFGKNEVLTPNKEFKTTFEKFLKKFATVEAKQICGLGDNYDENATITNPKNILKLFTDGNYRHGMMAPMEGKFNDEFEAAKEKANKSRSEEIKQVIEIQNNQITLALESLRDVYLPEELQDQAEEELQDGMIGKGINQRLNGLKIRLEEVDDALGVKSYNDFKQQLTDNAQKLAHLEKLANPWINSHRDKFVQVQPNLQPTIPQFQPEPVDMNNLAFGEQFPLSPEALQMMREHDAAAQPQQDSGFNQIHQQLLRQGR
jgi:hypothetical protein